VIQTIRNAWKVPELKKKMLFTVFALLLYRLGSAIPVPFVNTDALGSYLDSMSGTLFGLLNAMSGNAFSLAAVFALGIQPYINSSIIIQLLTVAIPALERLAKEGGEEGKKKINAITRYATIAIGLIQGFGYFTLMRRNQLLNAGDMSMIWVGLVVVLCFTAGAAIVMWLGEQITEFGMGNGISIILFAGIVSRIPSAVMSMISGVSIWNQLRNEEFTAQLSAAQLEAYQAADLHPVMIPVIIIGALLMIAFIVYTTNAERKIPVQYAKRTVGRRVYGGQSTHIPLKVNMSGVMPVIFAQTIATLPATIGTFLGKTSASEGFWGVFLTLFDPSGVLYIILYFVLILGFAYFYASIQFNPVEIANNLKKNGGFVPGFRPGKPTSDFITKVLNKITLFGALFLSVVAILPIITGNLSGMAALGIGGTSVIIVVSVALETVKGLEAQMMMRHYKGFLE